MPTFLAVRCYACGTFQATQKTKQPRWSCKLCQEKQSLQRAYATSDAAKDIRSVVQELNFARGAASPSVASGALEECGAWGSEPGEYQSYGATTSGDWHGQDEGQGAGDPAYADEHGWCEISNAATRVTTPSFKS